ncbi:apelin receptor A-like [Actinia tenebrosa]|uniref:Apelin receptor A-like n=1 Tax=Actinia tenebrosa TaxID=6105 RepID=A0A6P8IYT7_ACTTE|nr:apelin receptor A-like [Actinia tenebrosa]
MDAAREQIPNGNHSFLNSTSVNPPICFAGEPLTLKSARVMVYIVIFLVSLMGNLITVITVQRTSRKRKFVHLYLMNMAIADLVITVVYMPRTMVRFFYGFEWLVEGVPGLVLCRMVSFLHHASILASIFSLFGTAFDRFCAVMYPLKRITTRRVAITSLVLIWILAGILRSPFLISPNVRFSSEGKPPLRICSSGFSNLFGQRLATLYRGFFIVLYIICLVLIVILYLIMIGKLCRQKSPGNNEEATKARQKAGKRLIEMLISIAIAFVLCWLLYFIAIPIHGSSDLPCHLSFFTYLLAHSNSAVNPCLLAFFDSEYRGGYTYLLRRMSLCKSMDKQFTSGKSQPKKEEKQEPDNKTNATKF